MNATVINNNDLDVWTLEKESGGTITYATFRWDKDAKTASSEFTIQFSRNTEGWLPSKKMPVSVKTAREEWNTLVEAGWTRSD